MKGCFMFQWEGLFFRLGGWGGGSFIFKWGGGLAHGGHRFWWGGGGVEKNCKMGGAIV